MAPPDLTRGGQAQHGIELSWRPRLGFRGPRAPAEPRRERISMTTKGDHLAWASDASLIRRTGRLYAPERQCDRELMQKTSAWEATERSRDPNPNAGGPSAK